MEAGVWYLTFMCSVCRGLKTLAWKLSLQLRDTLGYAAEKLTNEIEKSLVPTKGREARNVLSPWCPGPVTFPKRKLRLVFQRRGCSLLWAGELLCCAIIVCNYLSNKYLRGTEKYKEGRKEVEKWVGMASWAEGTGHASTSSQGRWEIWGGESISLSWFHVLTALNNGGSMRLHAWVFWLCPKGLKVGFSSTSKTKKISQNETFIQKFDFQDTLWGIRSFYCIFFDSKSYFPFQR